MTKTQKFIEELTELEKKATPGPWASDVNGQVRLDYGPPYEKIAETQEWRDSNEDAQFIAHSRNALPKLLEALKVLSEAMEFYSSESMNEGTVITDRECMIKVSGMGAKARQALQKVESVLGGEK